MKSSTVEIMLEELVDYYPRSPKFQQATVYVFFQVACKGNLQGTQCHLAEIKDQKGAPVCWIGKAQNAETMILEWRRVLRVLTQGSSMRLHDYVGIWIDGCLLSQQFGIQFLHWHSKMRKFFLQILEA